MIDRIKALFDISLQIFDMPTLQGIYFLPFLAAFGYLLLTKDSQHEKVIKQLIFPCAIGLLILLSPLIGKYAEHRDYAQAARFYWLLPFEFVVLYCIADSLKRISGKKFKLAFIGVLTVGLLVCTRPYNLYAPKVSFGWPWEKADNLYKIPAATYEICNTIQAEQNGAECRAAFPRAVAMYARQYDASIIMPYGSYGNSWQDTCFTVINADEINLDDVDQTAMDYDLDYFVLDQGKITSGTLTHYAELSTVQDGDILYGLYQRT